MLQNVKTQDDIERLIRKINIANVDLKIDIRLEQIARLVALDPFTADHCGETRLRREMENVLALEQRFLTGADGERPMTFKRKASGADRIGGQRVSVRKKSTGVPANRTNSRILSAE
jgi:hypothetical protein